MMVTEDRSRAPGQLRPTLEVVNWTESSSILRRSPGNDRTFGEPICLSLRNHTILSLLLHISPISSPLSLAEYIVAVSVIPTGWIKVHVWHAVHHILDHIVARYGMRVVAEVSEVV